MIWFKSSNRTRGFGRRTRSIWRKNSTQLQQQKKIKKTKHNNNTSDNAPLEADICYDLVGPEKTDISKTSRSRIKPALSNCYLISRILWHYISEVPAFRVQICLYLGQGRDRAMACQRNGKPSRCHHRLLEVVNTLIPCI
jgi:hypothetical protein